MDVKTQYFIHNPRHIQVQKKNLKNTYYIMHGITPIHSEVLKTFAWVSIEDLHNLRKFIISVAHVRDIKTTDL